MADPRTPAACPLCAAAVRPGAPFCTLCYTDLRPEPALVPVQPLVTATQPDPLTAPLHVLTGAPLTTADPVWPCGACGTANPLDEAVCRSCGSQFLAAVREDEPPLLALPVVGDVSRLSRLQGVALAVGVVGALLAVLVVLGLLTS